MPLFVGVAEVKKKKKRKIKKRASRMPFEIKKPEKLLINFVWPKGS